MVRPLARPRRKEKSGLVLLVNYVVGGVLGLALGLLLLWWGFRRDPLELGPKTAEYAPWIVPAQFHGKAAVSGDGATTVRTPAVAAGGSPDAQRKTVAGAKESAADLTSVPSGEKPAERSVGGGLGGAVERQPMPDLHDLLPDGPSEQATPSP